MASYGFSDHFEAFSSGGFVVNGGLRGGLSAAAAASLVLDSKKGELVKAPATVGKKGISEAKALVALKNHSDAERRRRERINAHLSTLRGLVPCNEKMDKATLLAEVIRQVKELKKNAAEASKGLLIPMDADQVHVEPFDSSGATGDGAPAFKASICCGYRPELLSDIRQALDALPMKMVRTEISTLGDRLKILFVFTYCIEKNTSGNPDACRSLASSVQETLSSVLDRASALAEYSPRITLPGKRRRYSYFDSSSSSS